MTPPVRAPLRVEDYVSEVLAGLTPLDPVRLPLAAAHGCVLAEDLAAVLPVPPWTNSGMDGYAVRAADVAGASPMAPVTLPVTGDVPAGRAAAPLVPGTAQRIMTGAILPDGADAVVPVEDTDQEPGPAALPGSVEIRAEVPEGRHVRTAGADTQVGAPVLTAGTVLDATALASAASVGHGTVSVRPRVRVAVLATGAELVDPGEPLTPGVIPDSNSVLTAGLATEHGAEVTWVGRVGDDPAALVDALVEAAGHADLVVTTGGVSAGAFDPLKALATPPGGPDDAAAAPVRLAFVKVAMQPGKPQGHGTVQTADGRVVPVIALPGNPVSVFVSFTTIVAPALAVLAGRPVPAGRQRVRAAATWRSPAGRRQHVPVRFVPGPVSPACPGADDANAPDTGGAPEPEERATVPGTADGEPDDLAWVAPTHRLHSGSHLVASLHLAQALAVVPEEATAVEVGDELALIDLGAGRAPSASPLPAVPGAEEPR